MSQTTPSDDMVTGETYRVVHRADAATVAFSGILRLNGLDEYAPISAVLSRAALAGTALNLDLRELEFLNSSGIVMMSRFVIEARNKSLPLTIRSNPAVSWQAKSLANLQRLMPALAIESD